MPVTRCSEDGSSGWKYGDRGRCYTGPGAKKKAIKQGLAIQYEGGEPFNAGELTEYDLPEVFKDGDFTDKDFRLVAETVGYSDSEIRWGVSIRANFIQAKTYEVKYEDKTGRIVTTSVSAKSSSDARKYVKSEHPDAKIVDVYEA